MKPSKIEREIQVLKSLISILEKHKRGKRRYERRKARILSLAAMGLPANVIAKQVGTFPYYVRQTLRRGAPSSNVFSVGTGHMHDQQAAADS